MASNYTGNYNLNQWAASDRVLRTEFNADNAKIDAAIKAADGRIDSLTSTVSGKVSTSAFNSLQTTVNSLSASKADKTALDALKTTVTQHTAELKKKGNCQLYAASYTGTGRSEAANPNSLTFPKPPEMVLISRGGNVLFLMPDETFTWTLGPAGGVGAVTVAWDGASVQWYSTNAKAQMNESRTVYPVIALIRADG